jgi:hypothetical protein
MGPVNRSVRSRGLLLVMLTLPAGLFAQQFENVPSLYFTRAFGAPDPLPQVIPIASTAANFAFSISPSVTGGGTWLTVSPTGNVCCTTPRGVIVTVDTGANGAAMAAATYTGQIVFSASGVTTLTVSVTFVIAATNTAFFDDTPGQVSFSMKPNGQPPAQVLQIRGAGTGSLAWTLTTSTFNAANWLNVSITSGTAPSLITVSIAAQNLPGGGATPGIYSGQLLFQQNGGASVVTVPIGVTVAANAMDQVNALSFNKTHAGLDPLSQIVTIANPGSGFAFSVSSATANGSLSGTWLSVSPAGNVCCTSPRALTVSVATDITLAAGTYTGQFLADSGAQLMVIPVTLTVSLPSTAFFDNIAGQMSFFFQANPGNPPPSQFVQIRNAGSGSLNWTVTATTFDSGNWLTVSNSGDTAPNQVSIGIVPASLPGLGLTPGIFTANLLFQAQGVSVTVPITVQVGSSFEQVNGIAFTMLQAGADPLPQNITIQTPGTTAFAFSVSFDTASGGNWLAVSPFGNVCCTTPRSLEVSVIAPITMAPGIYTAEISIYSSTTAMTVPVTLTVAPATSPFFDTLPGEMTFFMQTPLQAGVPQQPAPQVFQIRNPGAGTLNWTLTPITFDGGDWLNVSAPNGAAPALITVSIVPGSLPNGGLVAGVFTGQLLLQQGLTSVTIPVIVDVGANVFEQTNGINFTMPRAGANALPQVLTVSSTGTAFAFSAYASTSTGGNWLTISPSGNVCCTTPRTFIVTVNPAVTLAAGIYSGQISFYSSTVSETVPVTLTVAGANTPFFDDVPGQLPYSLMSGTNAPNPASQIVQLRNAGTGTLSWTAQTFTSDGGNWLTVSAPSGTAPSLVSIGIITQNLQGAGLTAGLFTGQVLFIGGNSSVTIPVSVRVGGNAYQQINGINFTVPQNGVDPLPQILTAASISTTNFAYSITAETATGGSWMTVSPSGNVCCTTPTPITVSITAPAGLAAGTYTGEIIVDAGTSANVVPVNLAVSALTVPFFDNLQGQMSFFANTNTSSVSQNMLIEGLGASGLNWTVTPMTADTGDWLTLSSTSGAAPSSLTVGVNIANLPGTGLDAGQFTGQLLFQSSNSTSSITVPVVVQLGPNIFSQGTPLNFSMAYAGGNPLTQSESVTSSGTAFAYSAVASSGNGGDWLSVSPFGNVCCTTPHAEVYSVNGAPGSVHVPAGVHTGQVVYAAAHSAMTVPVLLTVQGLPVFSIAKSHTGNFTAGQVNATYSVTVSNLSTAGVGPTNGLVTVTETVPTGMSLQSMA